MLLLFPLSSLVYIPFSVIPQRAHTDVLRARIPMCLHARDCVVMLTREKVGNEIRVLLGLSVTSASVRKEETEMDGMQGELWKEMSELWCGVRMEDVERCVRDMLIHANDHNLLEWYALEELIRCGNG